MKRVELLQRLQRHGCVLKREGGSHFFVAQSAGK